MNHRLKILFFLFLTVSLIFTSIFYFNFNQITAKADLPYWVDDCNSNSSWWAGENAAPQVSQYWCNANSTPNSLFFNSPPYGIYYTNETENINVQYPVSTYVKFAFYPVFFGDSINSNMVAKIEFVFGTDLNVWFIPTYSSGGNTWGGLIYINGFTTGITPTCVCGSEYDFTFFINYTSLSQYVIDSTMTNSSGTWNGVSTIGTYTNKISTLTEIIVCGTSSTPFYFDYMRLSNTFYDDSTQMIYNLVNSFNFNFQQNIGGTNQYSENSSFANITTWNWLALNSSIYWGYAFRFTVTINIQSLSSTPIWFIFNSNSSNQYNFGFDIGSFSSSHFQTSCFIGNSYASSFFIPYSTTINFDDSYIFVLTYLYSTAKSESYVSFEVYTNYYHQSIVSSEIRKFSITGVPYLTPKTPTTYYTYTVPPKLIQYNVEENAFTPFASINDELCLNVSGITSITNVYYEDMEFENVIPYSISSGATSFDGYLFTFPTGQINYINITFYINPNILNQTCSGNFYVYESQEYFMTIPNDNDAESYLNSSSNYLESNLNNINVVNSQMTINVSLRVYQSQTEYENILVNVVLFENVGDYPNFIYSNIQEKTSTFAFSMKWSGYYVQGGDLFIGFGGLTLMFLIMILILLGIPTYYAYTKIGKKAIYIGLVLGCTEGFLGLAGIPLWAVAIMGGVLVFLIYQKIRSVR